MLDGEYRSQLAWHAGFYFAIATMIATLWDKGLVGSLSLNRAAYLVLGTLASTLVVGNVNYWLSRMLERRANAEHSNLTASEALVGSQRTRKIGRQGHTLGWVMTGIAVGAALVSYAAVSFWGLI